MGKTKTKSFLGSGVRNNPTNYNVACNEEDLENASEDDWQRISHQLQSGMIFFFKYVSILIFMSMNDIIVKNTNFDYIIKVDEIVLMYYRDSNYVTTNRENLYLLNK